MYVCASVWLDIHIRDRARAYRATVEKGQDPSPKWLAATAHTLRLRLLRVLLLGVIVSEVKAERTPGRQRL
jgi:hypothetical protein